MYIYMYIVFVRVYLYSVALDSVARGTAVDGGVTTGA